MDAVEDIKSRLSIEDVIGEYVELKRSGRNFKALSPFTSEKTPSFMVSPEKQIWHDFSSGRGGNMFSFVMEMEGLDFKGALELLARKANIDLGEYQKGGSGDGAKRKQRLYDALEAAAHFYQRQFTQDQEALQYVLKKRNYTKQTALDFRIGYAPQNGVALHTYLNKKGFTAQEQQQAGLIVQRYNRPRDMFRGRVTIPLMDPQARVVGFTARQLLADDTGPKYINTPQTILYDKGRHVYGLHLAKEAIRKAGYAVLVEGNLDVVAAHQAQTRQVVATAGTALTKGHIKAMLHFSDDIRICFDQDAAGQNAIERSIAVASEEGVSLSVLPLPAGKDPDDLIQEDIEAWKRTLEKPVYAADWLMGRYEQQLDISTAQGKREFSDVMMRLIASMKDQVEQEHYIGKVAAKIQTPPEVLRSKLEQQSAPKKYQPKKRTASPRALEQDEKQLLERQKLETHFLAIMLFQPALRASVLTVPGEALVTDTARELVELLKSSYKEKQELGLDDLIDNREYGKILELQFEELYKSLDLVALRDEVWRLKARLIEQFIKHEKQVISQQLHDADEKKQSELLDRVNRLNALMNQ